MVSEPDDKQISHCVAIDIARQRNGGVVEVLDVPDETDRDKPAVDLLVRDQLGTLAIEHTKIMAMKDQIKEQYYYGQLHNELENRLEGRLPPNGAFTLHISRRLTKFDRRTRASWVEIAEWIAENVLSLKERRPRAVEGTSTVRDFKNGLGPLELIRWSDRGRPRRFPLIITSKTPDEIAKHRRDQTQIVLSTKVPKLLAAEADESALVVETVEWQMTSAGDVMEALQQGSKTPCLPLPDWIYMWEPYKDEPAMYLLFRKGLWLMTPELHMPDMSVVCEATNGSQG